MYEESTRAAKRILSVFDKLGLAPRPELLNPIVEIINEEFCNQNEGFCNQNRECRTGGSFNDNPLH